MMKIQYEFIGRGAVVRPEPGRVYIDVGNSLEPGIIDHHQPGAPPLCAAALVLRHPEYVLQQVDAEKKELVITVHHQPDMDAVSGAFFARQAAGGRSAPPWFKQWADYVCAVDRGETALDPARPLTLYSLFMMRQQWVRGQCVDRAALDRQLLAQGFSFIHTVLRRLEHGEDCKNSDWPATEPAFAGEQRMVEEDIARYRQDLQRAEILTVCLPRKDGNGCERVSGLWLDRPGSILFKAWARGDTTTAPPHGFVFTAIQLSPTRHILSVAPDSPVYLKGLGDMLEERETEKRKKAGRERTGANRPGYNSPDPWYDGRSPLHNYTIIDAPRAGTMLDAEEVREVFARFEEKR